MWGSGLKVWEFPAGGLGGRRGFIILGYKELNGDYIHIYIYVYYTHKSQHNYLLTFWVPSWWIYDPSLKKHLARVPMTGILTLKIWIRFWRRQVQTCWARRV